MKMRINIYIYISKLENNNVLNFVPVVCMYVYVFIRVIKEIGVATNTITHSIGYGGLW